MRILILVLFLVGCSMPERPDFKPTVFNSQINLTVIIDNDLSRLGRDTATARVVGTHIRDGNNCTIWIPMIRSMDDEYWMVLARETGHCIWGYYHGNTKDIY